MIAALAEDGGIRGRLSVRAGQIQPASLDLRLGAIAYRVRASFLPGPGMTVAQRIAELKLHEFALSNGAVLETNCVYIVPLIESLALPADIAAATNPKSSTGRLDVFTRVIADETRGFDRVARGYRGPLYAEISPKTFPVLVREGSRLSQMRLRRGDAVLARRGAARAARARAAGRPHRSGDGRRRRREHRSFRCRARRNGASIVGYRAKRHTAVIDVERRAGYDVADFWEPIAARADKSLILDPDEFYILASTEAVQVPPDYAAEMVPFDPLVGEFRVHYAGFFDPVSVTPGRAAWAPARCSKCARAKCRSSSNTARSSAAWSMKKCWRAPTSSTAPASVPTIRPRAQAVEALPPQGRMRRSEKLV